MEINSTTYLEPKQLLGHLGLASGMWVGDFGVGPGGHFVAASAKAVGLDGGVVMFDVSKPALSGAGTRAKAAGVDNIRAVWTNLEIFQGATGVGDNSLNAGMLINVLYSSDKHKDILAEVHRMLKPQAKLLIVDWKQDVVTKIAPPTAKRLADGYVLDLAKSVGFSPMETFEASQYHWGLVVVKT